MLCTAAVMSFEWDQWLEYNVPLCLQSPSEHCKHLRLNVISWLIEDRVNLSSLSPYKANIKERSKAAPPCGQTSEN